MGDTTKNTTEQTVASTIKIADEVVGMIAAIAATEIDGVNGMAGNVTADILDKVGVKAANKGVKVNVFGSNVKLDIAIVMDYGFNIPSTCQKVQEKVKNSVENMTGLNVTDVNVRIAGITVPGK